MRIYEIPLPVDPIGIGYLPQVSLGALFFQELKNPYRSSSI